MKILVCAGLLLALPAGALAAADERRNATASPVVTVTWNIRSGLPSPEWSVTDPKAIEALRRLLANLPRRARPAGWHEFGGFTLWADRHPAPVNFPKYAAVKAGIVKIVSRGDAWGDQEAEFFQDKNGLENFLRAEARSRGFDTRRRGE